jgi:hypothetical protein
LFKYDISPERDIEVFVDPVINSEDVLAALVMDERVNRLLVGEIFKFLNKSLLINAAMLLEVLPLLEQKKRSSLATGTMGRV